MDAVRASHQAFTTDDGLLALYICVRTGLSEERRERRILTYCPIRVEVEDQGRVMPSRTRLVKTEERRALQVRISRRVT